MRIPFVDLQSQHLSLKKELDKAISKTIASSSFLRGPEVHLFEENFSRISQSKHCISCANGTDALYIAMKALGLGPGDEVITVANSWISTSESISQTGARVVFCDNRNDDFLLDVSKVKDLISEKTRGIIPVHLFGQAVDMDPLLKIAQEHNLWVLEDCAQAHIASYNGKLVGTFGDAATFSFYPGKNLGAMGDAGCIVTKSNDLAEHMALFARHGGKGIHKIEGINSRMDGLQAAILNVKIPHLGRWTQLRREAAQIYNQLLVDVEQITSPVEHAGNKHVYHLYVIKAENRNELKEYLKQNGVSTVINYPVALPFLEAYRYLKLDQNDYINAYYNQSRILSLPIFPEINYQQQEFVVNLIKKFYS